MRNTRLLFVCICLSVFTNVKAQKDTITSKDVNTLSFVLSELMDKAAKSGSEEARQSILIYSNAFNFIKKEYPDSINPAYTTYFENFKNSNKDAIDNGIAIYLNRDPMGIFMHSGKPCPTKPVKVEQPQQGVLKAKHKLKKQ